MRTGRLFSRARACTGVAAEPVPFVSVVVTTKNAAKHLPDLLADFDRLDWPRDHLEILIVDANSTDGTWELLVAHRERSVFPLGLARKPGFIGAGRNEGFRRARGTFIAVTDADMRVPPQWIRELVAGMEDGIGVVGGPNETANDDLGSRAQAAIPTHGPSVGAVPILGRNRWRQDYTTDRDVYGAVTRNSLFRKAAFDAVGGFDETLRVTEDPELMHRILQAGWRIRYRRAAAVRHVHRDSLRAFFRQQRNYAYWQAHVNRKHPELGGVKQRAPAAALTVFLLWLALSPWRVEFLYGAALAAVLALLVTMSYAVRAAVQKRDASLLVAVPVYFVTWQLAWAIAFPMGALAARRRP